MNGVSLELLTLFTIRGLSLGLNSRLYSACLRNVTLYGSETLPVTEEVTIRLERNFARNVR